MPKRPYGEFEADTADRSLPRESAPPKIKESASNSDIMIAKPLENRLEFLEKAATDSNRAAMQNFFII